MAGSQTHGSNPRPTALRRGLLWTGALLVAGVWQAGAAEPLVPAYQSPEPMAFGGSPAFVLLRTVASLALVLGLIAGLAWLTKLKGGLAATPGGSRLRLLEALPLGPGRTVYLVAIGRRVLLLGSDGQRLTTLSEMPSEEVNHDPDAVVDLDGRSFLERFREAGGEQ